MNVETVDNVGIQKLKQFHMVNIKMWRHPKYYKELRKRNREVLRSGRGLAVNQAPHVSDQIISPRVATASARRASGPGQQLGEVQPCDREATPSSKPQAPSSKHQASSAKLIKQQATSFKPCC